MLPGMHGSIMISDGGVATGPVYIESATVEHYALDPADALAIWTLGSSGTVSGTGVTPYPWRLLGVSADYEVSFDGGASWLSLGTPRTISRNRLTVGTSTITYNPQIRLAASGAVLATATITLFAEVDA